MSKAAWWRVAVGGAAFLIGLAIFAPASLLESAVQKNLAASGAGSFSQQGGSLWSGKGVLTLAGGKTVIPLSWRFDAAALLRLRLGVFIDFDSSSLRGTARVSRGLTALVLRDTDLNADLAMLANWLPAVALTRSSGMLRLRVADGEQIGLYADQPLPLRGSFDLGVENLVLPQWTSAPLGSYTVRVSAVEGAAEFAVTQSTGLLQLEGSGALRTLPSREFSFRGLAAPTRPGTQLPALLATLGTPGKDGRVAIDFRSPW